MVKEHKFLIMNFYLYFPVESEVLVGKFEELNEDLFYSQK